LFKAFDLSEVSKPSFYPINFIYINAHVPTLKNNCNQNAKKIRNPVGKIAQKQSEEFYVGQYGTVFQGQRHVTFVWTMKWKKCHPWLGGEENFSD